MFIIIRIAVLFGILKIARSAAPDSYNEKCDTELCNSTLMKKITCNSDNKCHGYLLPKGPCDCCPVCVGFEEKNAAKVFPSTTTESVTVTDKTISKTKGLPSAGEIDEKENEEYNHEYDYGTYVDDDDDDDEEESEETKRQIAKFLNVLLSEPKSTEPHIDQLKKKSDYINWEKS